MGQDVAFKNQSNQNINIYSLKADYSKPLTKTLTLELGTKFYYITSKNNIEFYNSVSNILAIDSSKSNLFNYKESNLAGYANLNNQFNTKWSTQIGIRVERTDVEGNSKDDSQQVKQNYTRLFPTAFIQYSHNDNNQFTANYTQRINRPDFESLNPFRYYTTPNSYMEGNPFLQPAITNSFELSYILKQKYYFNLFFHSTHNELGEIPILNKTEYAYKYLSVNFNNSYDWGFSTYLPIDIKPWWKSYLSLTAGFNGTNSLIDSNSYKTTGVFTQLQLSQQFVLSKKSKLYGEINLIYQPPGLTQGLYILGQYLDLSASLKKTFKDGRSTLSINIMDIFNATLVASRIDKPSEYSLLYGNHDNRGIRLTFSYKFGKNTIPKSRENKSGIEDEKERTK